MRVRDVRRVESRRGGRILGGGRVRETALRFASGAVVRTQYGLLRWLARKAGRQVIEYLFVLRAFVKNDFGLGPISTLHLCDIVKARYHSSSGVSSES